eukprot:5117276-Pleurochrysis_carterae.AAC.1
MLHGSGCIKGFFSENYENQSVLPVSAISSDFARLTKLKMVLDTRGRSRLLRPIRKLLKNDN